VEALLSETDPAVPVSVESSKPGRCLGGGLTSLAPIILLCETSRRGGDWLIEDISSAEIRV